MKFYLGIAFAGDYRRTQFVHPEIQEIRAMNNMSSRFELKQDEDSKIYFNFLNSAGEVILMSASYPEKTLAEEAIKDLKMNSLMSQQLAAGRTKDGGQFFVIKGSNGDVLVKSALYTSQMVMDNALNCVKDNVCVADVMDLT